MFRKSSFSTSGACVEVDLIGDGVAFKQSTRCGAGSCVQVNLGDGVAFKESTRCATGSCVKVDMEGTLLEIQECTGGTNCVQVDVEGDGVFKSATRCGSAACVEVDTKTTRMIQVRDSKPGINCVLKFTHEEWAAFIAGVKLGEFDLPE